MPMKKAVITILGIQSPKYDDKGQARVKDPNHKAKYYFEDNLKDISNYYNTLPLLIDKYSNEYEIVPIYTQEAKIFNSELLRYEKYDFSFNDTIGLIKNEKEYFDIFTIIDNCMNNYDRVIVDLTHGFRHLPILTIIDIVIQNFKSNKKIEKILFAKEIVKHTPVQKGEYEIVDLKEYLDIANISYVLSSFEKNYTISNHIKTNDKDFQIIIDMLAKFTEHIMANSLVYLLREEDSLIDKLLVAIDVALEHKKSQPLKRYLIDIKTHFLELNTLNDKVLYIQLFELSKIMNKKGYYLNSITLLNEALGWYCAESLRVLNSDFNNIYKKFIEYDTYKITAGAKNIVKYCFRGEYNNNLKIDRIHLLQNKIVNIENADKFASSLIDQLDKDRNNLAHANSGDSFDEISKRLESLFGKFQTYCIDQNILKQNNLTLEDLKDSFN